MRIQGSEGKRASKSFLELAPGEEAKLLASMAEAERRETTSAADILQQIRRSRAVRFLLSSFQGKGLPL